MGEEFECLCLECGISSYLPLDGVSLEDLEGSVLKLLGNCFCTECGGNLVLVGKAGDEPHYKLAQ